jgi:protoporphyrinogen/coproporphyrinogen III oxidase
MASPHVAVVGGGIAGLAAAFELARRDCRVSVFERSAVAGGLIRTDYVQGFVVEGGPDGFLMKKRGAAELCAELGLTARLVETLPPRRAFVLRNGTLRPLPDGAVLGVPTRVGAFVRSGLISPVGRIRALADLLLPASVNTVADDRSIGSVLRRRLGDEVVDWMVEPILGGIHAGDVDRLSARSTLPAALHARSIVRALRRTPTEQDNGGPFRSFPQGMRELVNGVVAALPEGWVRCNAAVAGFIGVNPQRLRLSTDETVEADGIVLATPAPAAAELLASVDAEAAALCRDLRHVSVATVSLGYERDAVLHPLAGTGFVVPAAEQRSVLLACTWASSKWPGRAPAGHVLLRAYFGGARKPDVLGLSDDALVTRAHEELSRLLGLARPPHLAHVVRWPLGSPQHDVGHASKVRALDDRLARQPGLAVVGASYRATGIPDVITDARRVAAGLADRLHANW